MENEPYPSPLQVPETEPYTVARWNDVTQGSGIYCYRIRVNTMLPMEFLLSHEFAAAIAKSPSVENFVSVPLVEYVIQYKWESWGSWATLINGGTFCLYLITTTASMLYICSDSKAFDDSKMERTPLFLISVAFSLIFNTLLMMMTTWQFSVASKIEFFSSIWNVTDIAMIVLCHVSLILGTVFGPTPVNRTLCSLLSLILWSRTLYYGRGSTGLSSLIDAIKHILYDMRYFILILTLFLVAFAVSFRVLGVFDSLFFSFILCFNMMLGDVSFYYVRGHIVAQLLYVTFLVSVAIILLNSLIALMEHSLQRATQRKEIASLVSRITLLTELELKMRPLTYMIQFLRQLFGKYKESGDLVVLVPETCGKPDLLPPLTEEQMLRRMHESFRVMNNDVSEVKKIVYDSCNALESRVQALESRMAGIDDKLDRILALVSFSSTQSLSLSSAHRSSLSATLSGSNSVVGTDINYSYFGPDEDTT